MFLNSIILLIILLLIIYYVICFQKNLYWKNRNVPFIPVESFNLLKIFDSLMITHEKLRYIYKKFPNEKYCGFYIFLTPVLMIRDINLINIILARNFTNFHDKRSADCLSDNDPLTQHLIALNGKKWKNLRGLISPIFSSKNLKSTITLLQECADALISKIENSNSEPINGKEICSKFTADVISSFAFGINLNSLKCSDNYFMLQMANKAFNTDYCQTFKANCRIYFPYLFQLFGLTGFDKRITEFFCNFVKVQIKYREQNQGYRNDLLQLLMDMKNQNNEKIEKNKTINVTDNLIAAQAYSFFVGGYDTSSITMNFALYEIAKNELIYEKLKVEIDSIFMKFGQFTYESVKEMNYLNQIIQEVLRVYPPGYFIPRVCTETCHVPEFNLKIEKGTKIIIPILEIHHDEKYHMNHSNFDPERFTSNNECKILNGAYIPFGFGPRKCIGSALALYEIKIALATIISKFKILLDESTKLPLEFKEFARIYTLKTEIYFKFLKRDV